MSDQKSVLYEKEYTVSVPVIEYIVIGHTAIHKKFFMFLSLTLWVVFHVLFAAVLGIQVVGAFYGTLLLAYVNFNLANWVVIPIQALFVAAVVAVLYLKRRAYRKRHLSRGEREKLQAYRREEGVTNPD